MYVDQTTKATTPLKIEINSFRTADSSSISRILIQYPRAEFKLRLFVVCRTNESHESHESMRIRLISFIPMQSVRNVPLFSIDVYSFNHRVVILGTIMTLPTQHHLTNRWFKTNYNIQTS